jgi:hypothetical protein
MPKKREQKKEDPKKENNSIDPVVLCEQYKKDWDSYSEIRADWDEKEAILLNRNLDSISKNSTKSQVFDPRLSTIVFERMYRVMNRLPTGKVRALTKKNKGKSMMMDLILHNYVEPNAKSQYGSILHKLRMENLYSHVYGSYGHLVDYVVTDDYVGPDITLISPYDLVPQPGKYDIHDCQYVFVGSWVSKEWLKSKKSDKWQNIQELLLKSKGDKTNGQVRDLDGKSYAERKWGDNAHAQQIEDYQQIYLVTRYERDRWITFAPDYDLIVRDIPNPHGNNRIPVVVKHSIPLRDRFWGLGEIERGKTLQYAINSLWNLYLDGVKFSIFPPKLVNLSLTVPSTIRSEAGANWVVKDINNAIREFNISPQGINSFQATYPALSAAMLNMAGTTDTSIASNVDPGMGKTPVAINALNARQNARDAYDRELQEEVIQETYDMFMDLISKKQAHPIKLNVFEEEIATISQTNPDILDMFEDGTGAEVIIKPEDVKDIPFKFYIDKGSTYKQDEAMQKQEITDHLSLAIKLADPAILKQTGKVRLGAMVIDVAELVKQSLITGGMQNYEKIIYEQEMTPEEMPPEPMAQDPITQPSAPQGSPMPQGGMSGMIPQGVNFEDPMIQQVFNEILNGQ